MRPTRYARALPSPHTLSTSLLLVILATLLTTPSCLHPVSADTTIPRAAVVADLPQPTVAVVLVPNYDYLEFVHEVNRPNILEKRQLPSDSPIIPPIGATTTPTATTVNPNPTTSLSPVLPTQPVTNTTTVATTTTTTVTQSTSSSAVLVNPTTTRTTISSSTSLAPTTSTTPTETKPAGAGEGGGSFAIVAGAVGGLVAVIGASIVAFKCTVNRKDRQRRNKEIAATLAESFDRSGGSDKYHELGDGPGTPIPAGAMLSRQGSQQEYFPKEGGDYYNNNSHYVQERYGGPNGGYDETEMSVMGGQGGATPASPYMGQAPSGGGGHYAGYNDYDYGNGNGNVGYNQGHQQGGYGYGQRY